MNFINKILDFIAALSIYAYKSLEKLFYRFSYDYKMKQFNERVAVLEKEQKESQYIYEDFENAYPVNEGILKTINHVILSDPDNLFINDYDIYLKKVTAEEIKEIYDLSIPNKKNNKAMRVINEYELLKNGVRVNLSKAYCYFIDNKHI